MYMYIYIYVMVLYVMIHYILFTIWPLIVNHMFQIHRLHCYSSPPIMMMSFHYSIIYVIFYASN